MIYKYSTCLILTQYRRYNCFKVLYCDYNPKYIK